MDWSVQVKECTVEGDMHVGASAVAQMRMPSDARPFCLLKKKLTCQNFIPAPPTLMIGPLHATYY